MSRCEHGQLITKFCICEECTWKDAGGCDACFKKYHGHASPQEVIPIQKLQKTNAVLIVKPDVKIKMRPLQEATHNYLTALKNQFSSSLDSISSTLNSKFSYPYLTQSDQLPVFKKIKNREFKKIAKNELKSYVDFTRDLTHEIMEANDVSLYYQDVSHTAAIFQKINAIAEDYKQLIAQFKAPFKFQRNHIQNIIDVTTSILTTKQEANNPKPESEPIAKEEPKLSALKFPRRRKISFQEGLEDQEPLDNTERKLEKIVPDKKPNLMAMLMGGPLQTMEYPVSVNLGKKTSSKKQEIPVISSEKKTQNKSIPENVPKEEGQPKKPSPLKLSGSPKKQPQKIPQNEEKEGDSGNFFGSNLFAELMKKGLNIPDMLVHTIIPAGQEKLRLYEEANNIKKQRVKVSVKKFEEKEAEVSPLLKQRRALQKKLSFQKPECDLSEIIEEEEAANNYGREDDQLVLEEKQANSLALLLQSLRLPAEEAIPILQGSIKYAENNLSATEYLSYLYLETGEPKKCLDLCNSILEQLKDSPEGDKLSLNISNNKAAALNILGRYSESISILEKCLESSSKDIYFKNLGDAYFSIGIYEKAVFNYEKAAFLNPEMDEALYNLAVCLFMQGHFNESKLNIERALQANKNSDYIDLLEQVSAKVSA